MTTEELEVLKAILAELRKINENIDKLRKETISELRDLASDVRSVI